MPTEGISLEDLETVAQRMGLAVCAPGRGAVDAQFGLFSPKGTPTKKLGVAQIQSKNHGNFRPLLVNEWFSAMDEAAEQMYSGNQDANWGLDVVLHMGDKRDKRAHTEFCINAKGNHGHLLLSTDSELTLFQSAIKIVTKTEKGKKSECAADKLTACFAKLIGAEQRVSFKDKSWSAEGLPDSAKTSHAGGELYIKKEIEMLLDAFNLQRRQAGKEGGQS